MNVAVHPRRLDFISLCSGGGGLDLGLELACPGARPVCLVEREAFAVAHLVEAMRQGLMAPAPVWSDSRTFRGREWRGLVDGVIGGIPCQPHSLAGKRLGEEDERDLWSTARRIIVQSGAWFVLIENVGGMLTSGGAERVWRDLRRLGFAVEAGLFTAAEVGASHRRERLFLLAVANDALWQRSREYASRSRRDGQRAHRGGGRQLADANCERLEGFRPDATACGRTDAGRPAGLCHRAVLVDAPSIRRGEGRPEPSLRSRRDSTAGSDGAMANADGAGSLPAALPGIHSSEEGRRARHGEPQRQSCPMGNSQRIGVKRRRNAVDVECASGAFEGEARQRERGRETSDNSVSGASLFPPGPNDLSRWRAILAGSPELEPSLRRVADGLASDVDHARIERLRMLGNGVVPLEAAYAVRTLATRLAASGTAAATVLLAMTEPAE